jgi:succinate dehydrogenase / fumarate reductase iron-sulfur subunit
MQVTFKIFRLNPEKDALPHYQTFELDAPKGATVLDGLREIKDHHDGSLTYRRSCRSAICGSCAVCVNGHSMLACKTQISDVMDGGVVTVEPLRYQKIVKDLVVDRSPFWENYARVKPWVVPDSTNLPEKENLISPQEVAAIGGAEICIQCGVCYSSCPIVLTDPGYLGPAALLAAYRYIADSRDTIRGERLRIVSRSEGVWRCHTVFNCLESCPKGLDPTWAIGQLKMIIVREKLRGRL